MTDIILSTQNGEPVASSLQIAESFEKRHDHVMRGIEDILRGLPKNGDTPMFYKTEYTHEQNGQTYPMYLMNRDGFSLLVMGFTGKAALEWKLKYIQAFNEMEKKLNAPQIPKLSKEMQALFLLDDRTQKQEQRLTALENTMTVDYNQQRVLRKSISRSVICALGDESAPAYIDNHVRSKVYSECNHDVQDWFRVNSVGNIPRKRFDEAVEYIQRWKPSTNTVMLIQQTNGQTSLFEMGCAK
jgi:Rha family phage regulatory protein|nr:MAG TPA: regulatory protein [Caudoviricetes sp.]